MQYPGNGVTVKNVFKQLYVATVALNKYWSPPTDLLYPVYYVLPAVAQVIEDQYVVPGLSQGDAGVGADKAGAAGNENHG